MSPCPHRGDGYNDNDHDHDDDDDIFSPRYLGIGLVMPSTSMREIALSSDDTRRYDEEEEEERDEGRGQNDTIHSPSHPSPSYKHMHINLYKPPQIILLEGIGGIPRPRSPR